MKKTVRILPYSMKSTTGRLLARSLGALRIFPDRNTYRWKRNHLVVNLGLSIIPTSLERVPSDCILNHPSAIAITRNKLYTFNRFFQQCFYDVPDWTCQYSKAVEWIEQGHSVYCRTTLTGNSGRGIVVAKTVDDIVESRLYTKGVNSETEYRVHIFRGAVIDFTKKAVKRGEVQSVSRDIRNYSKGWVFVREGVQLPQDVKEASVRAVASLGLDFGAVDVCTTREGKVCVFEVNSCAGMTGTTLQKYTDAIKNWAEEMS